MTEEKKKKEKKIIVDEDWKEQARREKEILAAQEEAEQKEKEKKKQRPPLPPGNFGGLVSMLTTQVLFALGALGKEGEEQKKEPDLEFARYHIDMLEALEEKTRGNLTDEQGKMLSSALHQVRMLYVKLTE